jgi:hypothetical protein
VKQIADGLWHWTNRHPLWGGRVSSYYLIDERVLLDPVLPSGGLKWFEQHDAAPEHIVLSNRHHDRDSWKLHEAFGCEVHCIANGAYELEGRGPVTPFAFGDELPGAIHVHEVNSISPDESALFIPAHRALACADGVVRPGRELEFVADHLMDAPDLTKQGLLRAYRQLVELEFDHLLLAHGQPVIGDGRDALREFARA